MAQIVYSNEALADFERIIEFLLKTLPEAALQTLMIIRSAVSILEPPSTHRAAHRPSHS